MKNVKLRIETERLRLIPLDLESLELLLQDRAAMEKQLGLSPSGLQLGAEMEKEIAEAIQYWVKFASEHPEKYYWGTNWEIVLAGENRSIGNIGMSGTPDKEGRVTIGYAVDKRYQKQGYGSEAVGGLVKWIFEQSDARSVAALTPVENLPSQKVLQNNGFAKIKEVEEEGMQCFLWEHKKDDK